MCPSIAQLTEEILAFYTLQEGRSILALNTGGTACCLGGVFHFVVVADLSLSSFTHTHTHTHTRPYEPFELFNESSKNRKVD
jgi:hypothetical protein